LDHKDAQAKEAQDADGEDVLEAEMVDGGLEHGSMANERRVGTAHRVLPVSYQAVIGREGSLALIFEEEVGFVSMFDVQCWMFDVQAEMLNIEH
jgi:hypothetical protein